MNERTNECKHTALDTRSKHRFTDLKRSAVSTIRIVLHKFVYLIYHVFNLRQ